MMQTTDKRRIFRLAIDSIDSNSLQLDDNAGD
jgi:hypothetical protein